MATTLSLDSIREAADKKYAGVVVDLGESTVELKNPLRLTKAERENFNALSQAEEGADADPVAYFHKVYEILAGEAGAKELLDALGDDVPLHMTLLEGVTSGLELGEASPSQD